MPPGLLDDDVPEAPRFDPLDPPYDDFSEAFRRATSDDPLARQIEPMVLSRLERRLGKPAADWTPDEHRTALRTLGFLVGDAYLPFRTRNLPPPEPKRPGRPRKPVEPGGALLSFGLLGRFAIKRRGRPVKWTTERQIELVEAVEASKSFPGEPALTAIRRSVRALLAESGLGQWRADPIAESINSQYHRSKVAIAKFRENLG
jgi:hypothetical protein